jgi:hypothetical protein
MELVLFVIAIALVLECYEVATKNKIYIKSSIFSTCVIPNEEYHGRWTSWILFILK